VHVCVDLVSSLARLLEDLIAIRLAAAASAVAGLCWDRRSGSLMGLDGIEVRFQY
jgi:hypothetical protein